MSLIIAIEGMDAAGKNTHSKLLAARMGGVVQSFPDYTTPAGALVHRHLKEQWMCLAAPEGKVSLYPGELPKLVEDSALVDAMVFQSIQTINRLEKRDEIMNHLAAGRSVVFDRYWASAIVYGTLDGLDEQWLLSINENVMPHVDLWVLIDIPLEESIRRRPERRDRYEQKHDYMLKVRERYLSLFKARELAGNTRWVVVNGIADPELTQDQRIEVVHERIAGEVEKRFGIGAWKK